MRSSVLQLVNNLGTIILALLLAFVVWISATLQADPFTDEAFPNVPITLLNQPEETVVFEPISEKVSVKVRAPQSVLAELKVTDFEATMDLSEVQTGTPTPVPVRVISKNDAVRIEGWEPVEQTVHLEAVLTTDVDVGIKVEGEVATGYQATRPAVTPNRVAVTGPETLLSQVESMDGSVDMQGARENVVEQVVVKPVDAEGRLVAGLEWTPDRVSVRIGVSRKVGFKPDVEVVPDRRGEPAQGYRLGSVSVQPSTVTLAGLPSVLNELPGFVETWPISVTEAIEDLVVHSPLKVPDSVVVVGVDYVTVTVEVLPIQSTRAMTISVETQGLRPEWVTILSPSVVDAILEGPDLILSELTPGDVRVIVDLFGLTLGTHRVEPDVLAPAEVTVVSIIPETIEVVIAAAPTPTPTLTMTPTVTAEP